MFVQIHMLQSMPPGNLNRDDSGQPKKCIFGGVTRGRISSQCLKRNIRLSPEFEEAFGENLATRSTYLPCMIGNALKDGDFGVPAGELDELMGAIAGEFKKENEKGSDAEADGDGEEAEPSGESDSTGAHGGQTGQLVFFTQPFVQSIAGLISALRKSDPRAYNKFIGRKLNPKPSKDEEKTLKVRIDRFKKDVANASKDLTVDIGMFGRMTTSDLVVNVEAACQVAHAISTHETLIEGDYFTAMDDEKDKFAKSQTDKAGAAYLGSGENVTYFNSAVYYKYLNLDIDALRKHLPSLSTQDAARAAGVLLSAAVLANPTGKQNSFASHGAPELILVEVSKSKRPLSYANAFLQPVEGGVGRNLMSESAKALKGYVESVAVAFAPGDLRRLMLAVGPASVEIKGATPATTLDALQKSLVEAVGKASAEKGKAAQ